MRLQLFDLFWTTISLTVTLTLGQNCQIAPFAIALRNCTFASGTQSWGNLIEIGSPPQRICLVPSTVINSTLVSQQSLCDISNTPAVNQCESLRGGFFNENSSTTWSEAVVNEGGSYNDTRSNPTWDHFNPPGFTKVGWDKLHFPGTAKDITFLSAGVALNQYGNNSNAGMIGLGKDSVFLADAVAQNQSPSKSWGLDSGSLSVTNPRNGELVIGGYNKGRLDGSFRWSNVSDMSGDRPCPLRTVIKEISVLLPNGSSYPLKSSAEDITACIEPYDNLFRFTTGMLLNWKQITSFNESLLDIYTNPVAAGSDAQNLSFTELGLPYANEDALEWSLTITLDNGYSTTLPHYEIQKPLTGWNVIGEKEAVSNVANVAILNAPTGENEVPTLGKIFLSRSYLAVDYPSNRFGLAEVLTTPSASDLTPLGCNITTPSTLPNTSTPKKKNLTLILGAVLGALAFITLLILIIYLYKRSKRTRAVEAPVYEIGTAGQMHQTPIMSEAGSPHMHMQQQYSELGTAGQYTYSEMGAGNEHVDLNSRGNKLGDSTIGYVYGGYGGGGGGQRQFHQRSEVKDVTNLSVSASGSPSPSPREAFIKQSSGHGHSQSTSPSTGFVVHGVKQLVHSPGGTGEHTTYYHK